MTTSLKYQSDQQEALRQVQRAFGFTDAQMKEWLAKTGLPAHVKKMAFAHEHRMAEKEARKSAIHKVLDQAHGKNWTLYNGDCIPVMAGIPDNSIHLTVTSWPFGQLYIYSDSEADMGNSADDDEFMEHAMFMIEENWRITVPGRICAVHCKDLPAFRNRDGAMGLIDFPGQIIRAMESINTYDEDGNLHGWQFHSRITIWKDPVVEMERTKNNGLLYKNFRTGSEACRQGMADYMLLFRKWDGNVKDHPLAEPVVQQDFRDIGDYVGTNPPREWEYREGKRMSQTYNHNLAVWQRYASPVWFDVQQMNVLNYQQTKGDSEKHICPLQLDVIGRCIDLWSNPDDVIFDPFSGIGSTAVTAIEMGRKAIGVELKPIYHEAAVKYCQAAEAKVGQPNFFHLLDEAVGD